MWPFSVLNMASFSPGTELSNDRLAVHEASSIKLEPRPDNDLVIEDANDLSDDVPPTLPSDPFSPADSTSYCPRLYESRMDPDMLTSLAAELALLDQTQTGASRVCSSSSMSILTTQPGRVLWQILREMGLQVGMRAMPANALDMRNVLEAIVSALRTFASHHDVHVHAVHILHELLTQEASRSLAAPCYAAVFDCLFALQQVDRVGIFEEAAGACDFADCVDIVETKLLDSATLAKIDLVTSIEFISFLVGTYRVDVFRWRHLIRFGQFLASERDPDVLKWAVHRLIPSLAPMLKHKVGNDVAERPPD